MWVEYWVQQAHPSFADFNIWADETGDGRWICKFDLPLINKTVESISETQVNAMIRSANKAAKLIDEYMKNHPEMHIENKFKYKQYVIETDDNGRFRSLHLSEAARLRFGKAKVREDEESLEAVRKAIKKIAKINNSDKDIFIKVIDKSQFSDEMSIEEILEKLMNETEERYSFNELTIRFEKDINSIIMVGYTSYKKAYEKEIKEDEIPVL